MERPKIGCPKWWRIILKIRGTFVNGRRRIANGATKPQQEKGSSVVVVADDHDDRQGNSIRWFYWRRPNNDAAADDMWLKYITIRQHYQPASHVSSLNGRPSSAPTWMLMLLRCSTTMAWGIWRYILLLPHLPSSILGVERALNFCKSHTIYGRSTFEHNGWPNPLPVAAVALPFAKWLQKRFGWSPPKGKPQPMIIFLLLQNVNVGLAGGYCSMGRWWR